MLILPSHSSTTAEPRYDRVHFFRNDILRESNYSLYKNCDLDLFRAVKFDRHGPIL